MDTRNTQKHLKQCYMKYMDTWNTVIHGCMKYSNTWIHEIQWYMDTWNTVIHGYMKCIVTKTKNLLFSTLIHDVRRETKVLIVRTKFSFISQYSTPVLHSIHPTLASFSSYPSLYLFYISSILPLLPSFLSSFIPVLQFRQS